MTYQKFIDLPPMLSAQGTVRLPGSKSISNRMLLLATLSHGVTEIRDLLHSDDTEHMLKGLRTLGVAVEALGDHAYRVQGCAGDFPVKDAKLFLGNAGTAFRPLTAVLALAGGHYELSGVPRMHERPIADLVDALRGLGANIRYLGTEGFPPLEIHPAALLSGSRIAVRGDVSSQFLSALLMALPLMRSSTTVEVKGELISKPYVEITLAMMALFGVQVVRDGWNSFTVPAGSHYVAPGLIHVEGDASSASYFLAAGAIGGGPVRVEGAGHDSIQGDVRFAEALQLMGARIAMGPNWMEARAPENGRMKGIELDCNHIPDAAMTLAVCALFADGVTTLRNIASWRVKETDRIAAMAAELRKFGATVEEGADFIHIMPPQSLILASQSSIDTYDDHRMAMCFSLAAFSQTGVRINDPQCVAKTFPGYFESFASVVKAVPVIAIDGPSASGKGTVAQLVAAQLGFHYLDSGALYRLLALAAQQQGVALNEEDQLVDLAACMGICFEGIDSWLDGVQVTDELRSEQSAAAASRVAAFPAVRTALLGKQHAFRRAPGLVADGRDMASVVFPDASLKIFLTASVKVRAERRYKQLMEKGMSANIPDLLEKIRARDESDSQRSVAPLQQMPGASLLDTTGLTIEQAVQEVLTRYHSMH
ncbi:bifunctional 3-phosphoshikimate 1-carboxyvinyltransferase/cytidylate kinase [Candidatus Nitrotoga arctica]|uniref:Multifunctional fusion protein n=1 Tax=Candidatus Nitrotoga arctica TaxID=453162 RepID=A0ABN8AII1_9PROT|nr:bifunctional 3-phosphoshikimate 1-carboxyvinyltransferase/cytidylate kinase [Candidatus Nitrotoga arctica]CAG9932540.1 Cytidylate kinase / 3-phosphoshikimate 1-carboxyvinyltransferase [Candidatus Nitrotoga arctica]